MGREAQSFTDSTELELTEPEAAMRVGHMQRLKVQLEVLMRAMEAIETPKDQAGVEKFAKAISAVNKAVREVNAPEKEAKSRRDPDKEVNDDMGKDEKVRAGLTFNSTGDPKYDGMYDWEIELERKLARLADLRRANRVGEDARPRDRPEPSG
jgi:hypothetical protein